jgi:hypothetical protein
MVPEVTGPVERCALSVLPSFDKFATPHASLFFPAAPGAVDDALPPIARGAWSIGSLAPIGSISVMQPTKKLRTTQVMRLTRYDTEPGVITTNDRL